MSVEKVQVLSQDLIKARNSIAENLSIANANSIAFFGGESVIECDTADTLIEASEAHSVIMAAQNELALATNLKIETPEQYALAAERLKEIKGIAKRLEDERKKITKPIDDSKKTAQEVFRPASEFLATSESNIKNAMIAFDAEQDRKRREEQRKAEEAAAKERARIAAEAAAAAAKAEAEAKKLREEAEAAAAAGDLEKAAKLESKANSKEEAGEQKAMALENQAASVIAAPVAQFPQKVSGISKRTVYEVEVTDLKALCLAVGNGYVPVSVIEANMTALNKMANALKGDIGYPGTKVIEKQIIGSRAA